MKEGEPEPAVDAALEAAGSPADAVDAAAGVITVPEAKIDSLTVVPMTEANKIAVAFRQAVLPLRIPNYLDKVKGFEHLDPFLTLASLVDNELNDPPAVHDELALRKFHWLKKIQWANNIVRDTKGAAASLLSHIEVIYRAKVREATQEQADAEKEALKQERKQQKERAALATAEQQKTVALPGVYTSLDSLRVDDGGVVSIIEVRTGNDLKEEHFLLPFVLKESQALAAWSANATIQKTMAKWPKEYKKDVRFVETPI